MVACFSIEASFAQESAQPNIVLFLADDLGWGDVGYHGSDIQTPHLDKLAASGVRLNQFYVQKLCTPTRAAIMTGRYPMRYGLQIHVIQPTDDYGLPLTERTIAQALKGVGYTTGIFGKWHLGHADPAYWPNQRGFDYQYGHYQGGLGYFSHQASFYHGGRLGFLDWHRNGRLIDEAGYTTDLIAKDVVRFIEDHHQKTPFFLYVAFNAPHTPLQSPDRYLTSYRDWKEPRRTFAGMVTGMDKAIGEIVEALAGQGMAENTLIIFTSDNGGPLDRGASNAPLRGGKGQLFEGGVRVPTFVVWPGKLRPGTVVEEPLHAVDLYPTLLKIAGGNPDQSFPVDGRDIWPAISQGASSPHEAILLGLDHNGGAIRQGDWKLIQRRARGQLYDLAQDPSETNNLSKKQPQRVSEMLGILSGYEHQAVPALPDLTDSIRKMWKPQIRARHFSEALTIYEDKIKTMVEEGRNSGAVNFHRLWIATLSLGWLDDQDRAIHWVREAQKAGISEVDYKWFCAHLPNFLIAENKRKYGAFETLVWDIIDDEENRTYRENQRVYIKSMRVKKIWSDLSQPFVGAILWSRDRWREISRGLQKSAVSP